MTEDHRHETSLDLQFLGNLVNARGPTVTGVEGTDDEGSR